MIQILVSHQCPSSELVLGTRNTWIPKLCRIVAQNLENEPETSLLYIVLRSMLTAAYHIRTPSSILYWFYTSD